MQTSIDFLKAICVTDRVYIRCLSPKNTPQPELAARGMTYTDKSGKVKKSTVNGYIDLQAGEFYRHYGKEYKPVADGWGHLLELNQQGYGVYFVVGHGGERNNDITHGSTLFHDSDRATLECQQLEIDRVQCELLQLNEVNYSLADFDRILPTLDVDRYCQLSTFIKASRIGCRRSRYAIACPISPRIRC